MRIAFSGASGTGKTTLATYVSERYGLPVNPVGSRSVAKAMGFDSPYDVDAVGRRAEFQRRLVTDKRVWENDHDEFVTDRTTIDNLVYTILHDVKAIDKSLLDDVIGGLSRYTHVFYCPKSAFFHVGNDPHRVKDETYHNVFDVTLEGWLTKCLPTESKLTILYDASSESRKRAVDFVLRGLAAYS
jgi:predicted ATPase